MNMPTKPVPLGKLYPDLQKMLDDKNKKIDDMTAKIASLVMSISLLQAEKQDFDNLMVILTKHYDVIQEWRKTDTLDNICMVTREFLDDVKPFIERAKKRDVTMK